MNSSNEATPAPSAAEASPAEAGPFSYRATLVGTVCALGICIVVAYAELVIKEMQIAICQFSPAAIGALLAVVGINRLLRAVSGQLALNAKELMMVYIMTLVAALISSRGIMEKLIPALVAVNYYATPENHWAELFFGHMPQWMVPFRASGEGGQELAVGFYEGLSHGADLPWRPWVQPLLSWTIIVMAVFFAFMCMAAILRRQWVDNEKLTFPLVQLPLDMVGRGGGAAFFADKLTWAGFALPAAIFTLNGLHRIYPQVPEIPLRISLNAYFTSKPWADMHMVTMFCSFAAVGFAYFLPSQLLFSLWAFFVVARLQDVAYSLLGWPIDAMPLYPTRLHIGYQAAGAYCVLAAFYVRAAWPHLQVVWRRALGGREAVDDANEFLPYRFAVWGLIAAATSAVVWCIQGGMSAWLSIVEMSVYLFIVALVMARSVAEAGMLMTETSFRPVDLVRLFTTKNSLGRANLTVLSFTDAVFTRDLRGCLMSTFLDGLKICDGVRLHRRHLLGAIAVAIVVGYCASMLIQLWLPYNQGAMGMYGYVYRGNPLWTFRDHGPAMDVPDRYDFHLPIAFGVGLAVAIFLSVMRMRLWWWPLYPLGYALCGSWTMIVFWFPLLVAWIIKSVLLRYAGMKAYTRLRPFFLGLILGEFFLALVWAVIGCIWRLPAPFFPWP
ncbi:MAG: DUF6785 family protein [Armatimonadota bacterium]